MLRLALPKGRLLSPTAAYLEGAGLRLPDYSPTSRSYRPSASLPNLSVKVFQEKDIPIQVAVGHYDLGVCGRDWAEELLARYPQAPLMVLRELSYGEEQVFLAASAASPFTTLERVKGNGTALRLAGEYPNLAEAVAVRLRLRRFRVFPLWGAAEVYPPEDADLVLVRAPSARAVERRGLIPLLRVASASACLIAHRRSWEEKDMDPLLGALLQAPPPWEEPLNPPQWTPDSPLRTQDRDALRLALPDGHQQPPVLSLLERAGARVEDYAAGLHRPQLGIEGVVAKVLRPQDMPLQVACGHFDLAITGQDWLQDHLARFPSSPVLPLAELSFGQVRVVAVVSGEMGVTSIPQLRRWLKEGPLGWLRVASEYVNLADQFAQEHHLSPYRVIPTWGASEAFLPEDADLLIENTQTGQTLARHGLRILEVLLESSACLITPRELPPGKRERVKDLVRRLEQAQG